MTDTSGGEPAVADVLTAINGLRVTGPEPVRALREDVLALGNRTQRLIDGPRGDMEQRFGLLMDAIADLRAGLEAHSGAIRDAQARSSSPPACSPPPRDPRRQDLDRAGGRTASTRARTAHRRPAGANLHTGLATTGTASHGSTGSRRGSPERSGS